MSFFFSILEIKNYKECRSKAKRTRCTSAIQANINMILSIQTQSWKIVIKINDELETDCNCRFWGHFSLALYTMTHEVAKQFNELIVNGQLFETAYCCLRLPSFSGTRRSKRTNRAAWGPGARGLNKKVVFSIKSFFSKAWSFFSSFYSVELFQFSFTYQGYSFLSSLAS